MLAIAFIISENESLVLLNRTAQRSSKIIALKLRDVALIEKIAGIEIAVADELVERAVQRIRASGGHDADLGTGTLSVFGAIGIGNHVEFANGVDTQKLAAGSTGRVIDDGSSGVFDSIQQEKIFLRPSTGHGKHIADRGVRAAHASRAAIGIIDDARVEGEKFILAAAVKGEIFHLLLADEAGGLLGGEVHGSDSLLDLYSLLQFADLEGKVDVDLLPDY